MTGDRNNVFVQRRTYRRRRMADAARLLPVLGGALILIPLLWTGNADEPASTASVMLYLFLVWIGLAGLAAAISRHLQVAGGDDDVDEGTR